MFSDTKMQMYDFDMTASFQVLPDLVKKGPVYFIPTRSNT